MTVEARSVGPVELMEAFVKALCTAGTARPSGWVPDAITKHSQL